MYSRQLLFFKWILEWNLSCPNMSDQPCGWLRWTTHTQRVVGRWHPQCVGDLAPLCLTPGTHSAANESGQTGGVCACLSVFGTGEDRDIRSDSPNMVSVRQRAPLTWQYVVPMLRVGAQGMNWFLWRCMTKQQSQGDGNQLITSNQS